MKHYLLLLAILFSLTTHAQTKLTFEYDAAGNQIKRVLCLNCSSTTAKGVPINEIEALTDDDLLKFSPEDVISYYPNPVKEELYLQWELTENKLVNSIQVVSLTGQVLRSYGSVLGNNNKNIAFQSYPSGVYLVVLYYSNGDQKSIKIIKQ